jgi:hypothetical protein
VLSEQIQARVNQTLRALFQTWKTQINGLNAKITGAMGSTEEENHLVDTAFGVYINEMIKQTLRVYTLSVALS